MTRDDDRVVAAQIGRPLRAPADVAACCHLGLPVVTRVPPLLDDGTPFPTRYWLTCPLATVRISRIESAGGVKALDRHAAADEDFAAGLDAAHQRYARERDALVPPGTSPSPSGGVGGATAGIKCLHAHYADHAAANANPVGEAVAPFVEPLDCVLRCVENGVRNPDWVEPR